MISTEMTKDKGNLAVVDHLKNDKVKVDGEYCADQKWRNPICYYINPSNRDAVS